MKDFNKYSIENVHFYTEDLPELLESAIAYNKISSLLDLGCGDGRLLYSLEQKGYLQKITKIVGVDLSDERCKQVKKILPKIKTLCSNACNVRKLRENSFDLIISNQVIEHIPNDISLVNEISRLLRSKGRVYLSTVLKKWYGWYFYNNNGKHVLDPTHVREYKSDEELKKLFQKSNLRIIKIYDKQIYFSLMDGIIRVLFKLGLLHKDRNVYSNSRVLTFLRKIKIPIIGYKTIEVLAEK